MSNTPPKPDANLQPTAPPRNDEDGASAPAVQPAPGGGDLPEPPEYGATIDGLDAPPDAEAPKPT